MEEYQGGRGAGRGLTTRAILCMWASPRSTAAATLPCAFCCTCAAAWEACGYQIEQIRLISSICWGLHRGTGPRVLHTMICYADDSWRHSEVYAVSPGSLLFSSSRSRH